MNRKKRLKKLKSASGVIDLKQVIGLNKKAAAIR